MTTEPPNRMPYRQCNKLDVRIVRDEGPPLIDYVTERKGELRK